MHQRPKNSKSWWGYGLPNKIIETYEPFSTEILCALFNKILNAGQYPKMWATAITIPIHKKKGSRSDPANYRGIGLLTSLGKVFNKIIKNRLYSWLEEKGKLSKCQAGFRKKMSTVNQIFVLETIANKYREKKEKLFLGLVDYSAAFDSLDRNFLFYKMNKMGIPNKITELIKSIYNQYEFCIKLDGNHVTRLTKTSTGVIQGDVLSGLLFIIYINDLAEKIQTTDRSHLAMLNNKEVPLLAFADDICLISTTPGGLQRQFDCLKTYCDDWRLTVNTNKTKTMVLKGGTKRSKIEKWFYDGNKLEIVNEFKYLGITINYDGKMKKHIENAVQKGRMASFQVSRFIQSKKDFPVKLAMILGQSLIQSVLAYGVEIFAWSEEINSCDKVMTGYYKKCLCLPTSAPNAGVELVLGRRSLASWATIRGFKFLLRLVTSPTGSLLADAYEAQKMLLQRKKSCWLKMAKEKLENSGLGHLWDLKDTHHQEHKKY